MITVDTAKEIIKKHFPDSKCEGVYSYKNSYYLLIAPSRENDYNDPFYIVDKKDGKYRFLNPMEDIDSFNEALENGPIKTY